MRAVIKMLAGAVGLAMTMGAGAVEPNKADPLYQSKGDQKRTYKFPETGEMIPYRTYVPSTWQPGVKLPLVLVLHGGGLDENAPFMRTPVPMKDELQSLAEQFGFIIVSPLGYKMSGGFGAPPPAGLMRPGGPPAGPRPAGSPPAGGPPMMTTDPKTMAYSTEDVMNTVELVEKEYGADTTKEFITGNSMGAIGTAFLVTKYPGKWVAMAPSEGGYDPTRFPDAKFGLKGALFIHKQDPNAPDVETKTAAMIQILAAQSVDARSIAVPNTVHENVWFFALPTTFHYFDRFIHPPVERIGPGPGAGPGPR